MPEYELGIGENTCIFHTDLRQAIKAAYGEINSRIMFDNGKPHIVGIKYRQGQGWSWYELTDGAQGDSSEYVCINGHLPLANGDIAREALVSALTDVSPII